MSLKLPRNHNQYYNYIIERTKKYIKLGYWSEIDFYTLDRWLNNFNTEEEKYLSALILDKIIYRNEATIKSLFSKMFHISLPNILEEYNIYFIEENIESWEKALKSKGAKDIYPFRFTTITSEKELGDSGADFMRRLRRYYLVNRELIIIIDSEKTNNVNTLIVIDDLIASGEQVKNFIEDNLEYINKYRHVIFMPLIAHEGGIQSILKKIERLSYHEKLNQSIVHIKPIEVINERNSFFYEKEKGKLIDGENTIKEIESFYCSFIKNRVSSDLYGYGDLSLLLIFSTGIPDNTLPIIHETNEEKKWYALYEKF